MTASWRFIYHCCHCITESKKWLSHSISGNGMAAYLENDISLFVGTSPFGSTAPRDHWDKMVLYLFTEVFLLADVVITNLPVHRHDKPG